MKSGTALRAVGAGWLRTKVVESGLPAGRDREVLNSGLLLAFSEIEVRDRAQLRVWALCHGRPRAIEPGPWRSWDTRGTLLGPHLRPTAADGRCREVDWARAEIPGVGKGLMTSFPPWRPT